MARLFTVRMQQLARKFVWPPSRESVCIPAYHLSCRCYADISIWRMRVCPGDHSSMLFGICIQSISALIAVLCQHRECSDWPFSSAGQKPPWQGFSLLKCLYSSTRICFPFYSQRHVCHDECVCRLKKPHTPALPKYFSQHQNTTHLTTTLELPQLPSVICQDIFVCTFWPLVKTLRHINNDVFAKCSSKSYPPFDHVVLSHIWVMWVMVCPTFLRNGHCDLWPSYPSGLTELISCIHESVDVQSENAMRPARV